MVFYWYTIIIHASALNAIPYFLTLEYFFLLVIGEASNCLISGLLLVYHNYICYLFLCNPFYIQSADQPSTDRDHPEFSYYLLINQLFMPFQQKMTPLRESFCEVISKELEKLNETCGI